MWSRELPSRVASPLKSLQPWTSPPANLRWHALARLLARSCTWKRRRVTQNRHRRIIHTHTHTHRRGRTQNDWQRWKAESIRAHHQLQSPTAHPRIRWKANSLKTHDFKTDMCSLFLQRKVLPFSSYSIKQLTDLKIIWPFPWKPRKGNDIFKRTYNCSLLLSPSLRSVWSVP